MPLSEHEQRLLEQIERALVDDDPKFASSVRTGDRRLKARRKLQFGAVLVVVGMAVMVGGAVAQSFLIGGLGSLVAFAGVTLGVLNYKPATGSVETGGTPASGRGPAAGVGWAASRSRTASKSASAAATTSSPASSQTAVVRTGRRLSCVRGSTRQTARGRRNRAGPPGRRTRSASRAPSPVTSDAGQNRARSRTSREAERSSPWRAVRSAGTSPGSVPSPRAGP